ncbi:MAG: potassium transporter Kup [Caulobacterales bacterium]
MTQIDLPAPAGALSPKAASGVHSDAKTGFWGLLLGSIGVVYGDIGTSPLYAFKESIVHVGQDGTPATPVEVYGVVSLMFWALMLIVTIKYAFLLMRLDNKGEGGVLSLAALAQRLAGKRTPFLLIAGMLGAALFYGDAMLTPAISVLSAMEGLTVIPALQGHIEPFILPLAIGILVGLFLVQKNGTARVGAFFGPICLVWFAALGALGLYHLSDHPGMLAALNPYYAISFLLTHSALGFVVLGSVFLTVTGAEALYADMGHFGRKPIASAWTWVVFPCLMLNYLGQGAMVINAPETAANPFFLMAPEALRPAMVVLAGMATIIASQAVISGAYSLTQQAIQLGLLPRMQIKQTSETHLGQIYLPQVNLLLMIGVIYLTLTFRSSSAMASAYGVSVIGAMITSSVLAVTVIPKVWKVSFAAAAAIMAPFIAVEAIFAYSNLLKLFSGGIVPIIIASVLMMVMWTWVRGSQRLSDITRRDLSLTALFESLNVKPPKRVPGTAIFPTAEPDIAPAALLHNLKHNHILHENIVILHVVTAPTPHVADDDRFQIEDVLPSVRKVTLTFGFMETPNISRALGLARRKGAAFDIMTTSFFVSRRALLPARRKGLARLQDYLFIYLARNATTATDFFHLPTSRVVELGAQIVV